MTRHGLRLTALLVIASALGACAGGPLDAGDQQNQIKPDPLAVGTWDLDRARSDPASTLPFACETSADKTSWPCIAGATVDTIISGLVLLDAQGMYAVQITHRVILGGTGTLVTKSVDESNIENSGGARTGSWGRSAMRIVLYPAAITSSTKYGDLSDTTFVHGLTTMSVGGARFILR